MEEPQHDQGEWRRKNKGAMESVPESTLRFEAKKVPKVRGERANHQG
jgi:hypothetical protein